MYGEEEEHICGKFEEWRLLGRLGVVDGIEMNGFLRNVVSYLPSGLLTYFLVSRVL